LAPGWHPVEFTSRFPALNRRTNDGDQCLQGHQSLNEFQQESVMFTKNKFAAAALIAVTLGATAFATTSEADAHGWGWGWGGFGAGLAAGALIGAASTAYAPTYVVSPGFRRCRFVPQYNVHGYYIGSTRVCAYY
jgi:hypothetical protein